MAHPPLIDALTRRIAAGAGWTGQRDAGVWRATVASLKSNAGASDAELARALRDVVQGRPPDARLDADDLRGLAHYLFIETALNAPEALVAVPKLLGEAESGATSLDPVLDFAARTVRSAD